VLRLGMNILDPLGPIGAADRTLLIDSLAIMLAIVVPTILAIFAFAFWFRASNRHATYRPNWAYSGRVELVVWSIPTLTIILLGGVIWLGSHQLDPARPLENAKQLKIQVVSLDWKWLFIYPDQKIATVNTLTVPAGTALALDITSASVMNVFFVPQLGSMIYAMNGMRSRLNLQADRTGTTQGLSAHFSGDGFPTMRFDVNVVGEAAFADWARSAAAAPTTLDASAYAELAKQSSQHPKAVYRLGDPHLFDAIVTQRLPPGPGPQPGPRPAPLKSPQAAQPSHPHSSQPMSNGLADAR
jgi:cytochrome o ubiquinol oxidase subunit 2